ncbi:6-hydroxymethylpterin diphosphokinase MptE-like protein [candidate division KSB1 bacterium]
MEDKERLWKNNLRAINKRFPDVADKIRTLPDDLELDERIRSGRVSIDVPTDDGRRQRIQSMHNPEKEVRNWLDGQNLDPTINLVLTGIGLGHPLKELYSRSADRDLIVVVEKSPAILRKALHTVDLSEPLGSRKVLLFLDEDPIVIFRTLRRYAQTITINRIKPLPHPITFRLYADYYKSVLKIIYNLYDWSRANVKTLSRKAMNFTQNMIGNLPVYAVCPGVNRLFGKFTGVPVVIIAAGPSLDKNLPYLRSLKGRALLIAVDTIIRTLQKEGVDPDMVLSIDYTAHTGRYFEGVDSSRYVLAFDPEVYPDVLRYHQGLKFAIDLEGKPVLKWARNYAGHKGLLPKGLSVAHTAFSLALEMGCEPIIFVGQDLAFSGGMSHSADVSSASMTSPAEVDESLEKVEGIDSRQVTTSKVLLVFLRHFEEMLEEVAPTVIDASEGGARIKGTEVMTLREVQAVYDFKAVDVSSMLQEAASAPAEVDSVELMESFRRLYRSATRIKSGSDQILRSINRIKKETSGPTFNKHAVEPLQRKITNLAGMIKKEKEVLPILEYTLEEVWLKRMKRGENLAEDMGDSTELDAYRIKTGRDEELFQKLSDAASSVAAVLKDVLKDLGGEDADLGQVVELPLDGRG